MSRVSTESEKPTLLYVQIWTITKPSAIISIEAAPTKSRKCIIYVYAAVVYELQMSTL